MVELINAKARRPTSFELHKRVVGVINEFIARSERQEWLAAFASDQFHLLIDDEYRVLIVEMAAIGSAVFYIPLDLN
jgi:hypothetical protein